MLNRVLMFVIVLSTAISVTAQTGILSQKITLKVKKQSMPEILKEIVLYFSFEKPDLISCQRIDDEQGIFD